MRSTSVYIAVTSDQYELPIAIADTGPELAALLGISPDAVWQREHQTRVGINRNPGKYRGYKIIRVDLEDDKDEQRQDTQDIRFGLCSRHRSRR